jgi:cytochrome c-type biogenesis protein CcmH/NrfG
MNEQDLELYEAYLDKSLDAEAKKDFEKRLATNEIFKTNFESYRESVSFLAEKFSDQEDQEAFEQNLEKISNEHFGTKTKRSFRTEIWKYAAVVVLLISIGGYVVLNQSHPTYNEFATTPNIALVQRSGANESAKKAEDAFNNRSFQEATEHLSNLLQDDPNNQELLLYRGIAQIETDSFANAYQDLDKVVNGTSVYKNEALWQKALGLLKQEEYDACKMVLVEIPDTADVYEKAQDLLKKL